MKHLGTSLVMFMMAGLPMAAHGEFTSVEFDSGQWVLDNADVVTYLDRQSVRGSAHLKDVDFQNGVIEFDLALTGERSYPGVNFRMQSLQDFERFYVRPHRAGIYPDAMQYTPAFNGIVGWQLYHGAGMTGGATFESNKWIRVRLEVHGAQARVFFAGSDKAAMAMARLKHGISRGTLGVIGPRNGSAHFSNFRFEHRDDLKFDDLPAESTKDGTLTDWELSESLETGLVDRYHYPELVGHSDFVWHKVAPEPSGLVNISRFIAKPGRGWTTVFARSNLQADEAKDVMLSLGYSDDVSIFLNGKLLFAGVSGYQSRDPSFLGLIGLHDKIPLKLRVGGNELLLIVSDTFGGWGFTARTD